MNCKHCQKKLLRQATPGDFSAETAAHLAQCVACQEWLQKLLKIEANVPDLPAPPSQAKTALVQFFRTPVAAKAPTPSLSAPPVPVPSSSVPTSHTAILPMRRRFQPRLWMTVAASVAAAVLLTLTGVWLGNWIAGSVSNGTPVVQPRPLTPAPEPQAPPPLAAKILDYDLRLAQAPEPQERVEILAELAGALHQESQALAQAGGAQELKRVANLYERVINDGVLLRAKDLPMGKRRAALEPIAQQLQKAGAASEARARSENPALGPAHQQMAQVAHKGKGQLFVLMEEAQP